MRSSRTRRRISVRTAAATAVAVLVPFALTACSSGSDSADGKGTVKDGGKPATVAVTPTGSGAKAGQPVQVTASGGTLTSVSVTDGSTAKPLAGTLSKGGTVWTSDRKALPGKTYKVTAETKGAGGAKGTQQASFSTARAAKKNKLELWPTAKTVGVAHPVSIVFDEPVANKAEVERQLKVTASTKTEGSWGWMKHYDGRDRVDWRPREYWKPGTQVRLQALLNGTDSGARGGFFAKDYDKSFTVGAHQEVKVDLDAKRLAFERAGKPTRTIPISGGDPAPGADKRSWSGTSVLMAKAGTIRMTSQSVGLGDAYDKMVDYSMHLTYSGAYAHAAPWNAAYFGKANKSSGCIGMSTANASSFYQDVQVGDPFTVTGKDAKSKAPLGNGYSNWNLSWQEWQKLSALS
ncbi:Ig-like domain-containing protein [Streptomyces sp. NPDC047315]|uniref:L,D-transpeptidase n=1 Tax=Streptomyces sp. NPDC047315 TaxID=3155142 RepID=UPI0033F88B90